MPESIGKRISRLRSERGWTQQYIADRLAISRVAISHIEMDLMTPGERTITLLAGLFKITPHDLVGETTYPAAKTDRLPLTAMCYTQLELELSLLENNLDWLKRLEQGENATQLIYQIRSEIWQKWSERLASWSENAIELWEKESLAAVRQALKEFYQNNP